MNLKTTASIIILLATFINPVGAQSAKEIQDFAGLFKPPANKPEYSLQIDASNEIKLLITSGFAFYKTFISSQDAVKCTFYPSCSVYALNTIKTNGFIGALDAIDRLTRCNGISPEKYPVHEPSHRLYDPVKKIHQ